MTKIHGIEAGPFNDIEINKLEDMCTVLLNHVRSAKPPETRWSQYYERADCNGGWLQRYTSKQHEPLNIQSFFCHALVPLDECRAAIEMNWDLDARRLLAAFRAVQTAPDRLLPNDPCKVAASVAEFVLPVPWEVFPPRWSAEGYGSPVGQQVQPGIVFTFHARVGGVALHDPEAFRLESCYASGAMVRP